MDCVVISYMRPEHIVLSLIIFAANDGLNDIVCMIKCVYVGVCVSIYQVQIHLNIVIVYSNVKRYIQRRKVH